MIYSFDDDQGNSDISSISQIVDVVNSTEKIKSTSFFLRHSDEKKIRYIVLIVKHSFPKSKFSFKGGRRSSILSFDGEGSLVKCIRDLNLCGVVNTQFLEKVTSQKRSDILDCSTDNFDNQDDSESIGIKALVAQTDRLLHSSIQKEKGFVAYTRRHSHSI